jgi:hypothetical protein
MAVGASHLALGDLIQQCCPRDRVLDERADVRPLVTKVIEVQHLRIGLAAVDARMIHQILADAPPQFGPCSPVSDLGMRDLALAVSRVPRVRVFALTAQADPLPRLTLQRPIWELDERLGLPANATGPHAKDGVETQLDRSSYGSQ